MGISIPNYTASHSRKYRGNWSTTLSFKIPIAWRARKAISAVDVRRNLGEPTHKPQIGDQENVCYRVTKLWNRPKIKGSRTQTGWCLPLALLSWLERDILTRPNLFPSPSESGAEYELGSAAKSWGRSSEWSVCVKIRTRERNLKTESDSTLSWVLLES